MPRQSLPKAKPFLNPLSSLYRGYFKLPQEPSPDIQVLGFLYNKSNRGVRLNYARSKSQFYLLGNKCHNSKSKCSLIRNSTQFQSITPKCQIDTLEGKSPRRKLTPQLNPLAYALLLVPLSPTPNSLPHSLLGLCPGHNSENILYLYIIYYPFPFPFPFKGFDLVMSQFCPIGFS